MKGIRHRNRPIGTGRRHNGDVIDQIPLIYCNIKAIILLRICFRFYIEAHFPYAQIGVRRLWLDGNDRPVSPQVNFVISFFTRRCHRALELQHAGNGFAGRKWIIERNGNLTVYPNGILANDLAVLFIDHVARFRLA